MGTDIIILFWLGGVWAAPASAGILRSIFWPFYAGKAIASRYVFNAG